MVVEPARGTGLAGRAEHAELVEDRAIGGDGRRLGEGRRLLVARLAARARAVHVEHRARAREQQPVGDGREERGPLRRGDRAPAWFQTQGTLG